MSLEAWGDESFPASDALSITEWLFRQPPRFSRGLIVNRPGRGMSFHGRLFQAHMWREIAMAIRYDRPTGCGRRWHLEIGRNTYQDSLRRARVNLYLARRTRRAKP